MLASSESAVATVLILLLYFLPTIIAGVRKHHQGGTIAVINFFLGWTLIGWIWALAWSVSATGPSRVVLSQPQPMGHSHTCANCGSKWTLAPGQSAYTCPKCGTANYLAQPSSTGF